LFNRVCTTLPSDRWRPENLAVLSSVIQLYRNRVPVTKQLLYQLSYAS
jgi:hypothetical protein